MAVRVVPAVHGRYRQTAVIVTVYVCVLLCCVSVSRVLRMVLGLRGRD